MILKYNCKKITAYLGFTCPPLPEGLSGSLPTFYKSPTHCQKYFMCINGRPRLQTCGEGQAFSEITKLCEPAENVQGWYVLTSQILALFYIFVIHI